MYQQRKLGLTVKYKIKKIRVENERASSVRWLCNAMTIKHQSKQ